MQKRRVGKKAYFFILDSILALSILAIGAFIVFVFYLKAPPSNAPEILSEDLMSFFAGTKVKDLNNVEVGLGGTYWSSLEVVSCNGDPMIPSPDSTLLEHAALLYEKRTVDICYIGIARTFVEKLAQKALPPQYTFEFWINDEIIYPASEQISSKNAAKALIPSKKIAYGIMDQLTGATFGPYEAEILVWR